MNNDEHESVQIPSQYSVKSIIAYARLGILVRQFNGNPTLSKDQLSHMKTSTLCMKI